jgi:RecA/RadA recombinase
MPTLDQVSQLINKNTGAGTVVAGSDVAYLEHLPTGIFMLTWMTGGGYPINQVTRIKGPNRGGKTTTAIQAMDISAMTCWRCMNIVDYCTCGDQEPDRRRSVYIDVEGTLNKAWVKAIGVPDESWHYALTPDSDDYFDMVVDFLAADDLGVLVFDAIGMLEPPDEVDRASGNTKPGSLARLVSSANRKIRRRMTLERLKGKKFVLIFLNHISFKTGMIFGSPLTEPGGENLKHFFSLGIDISQKSYASDAEKEKYQSKGYKLAQKHHFSIDKEKQTTTGKEGEFIRVRTNLPDMGLKKGMISDYNTILAYAKREKMIVQSKKGLQVGNLLISVKNETEAVEEMKRNKALYYQVQKELVILKMARNG